MFQPAAPIVHMCILRSNRSNNSLLKSSFPIRRATVAGKGNGYSVLHN